MVFTWKRCWEMGGKYLEQVQGALKLLFHSRDFLGVLGKFPESSKCRESQVFLDIKLNMAKGA